MRQVVWMRIAAMEVYIRQAEKHLIGKTSNYWSRLLRHNMERLLLQDLTQDLSGIV